MPADKLLVSVIMPCYNSEGTIRQAIESVLSQDYSRLQLIVVDDFSTDLSRQILDQYKTIDDRVEVLKNNTNQGVAYSRNRGLEKASGKYVCFLDADDYLLPGSIKKRVECMQRNSYKIIYGSYIRQVSGGGQKIVIPPLRVSFFDLLRKNYIGNLTGFYDAESVGKIMQADMRHEDYLMWCMLLRKVDFAYSVGDDPLAVYRVNIKSLSGNKVSAFVWHWLVLRRGLNINLPYAFCLQLYYLISSILRRL